MIEQIFDGLDAALRHVVGDALSYSLNEFDWGR